MAKRIIMLIPIGESIGLTTISLGLIQAIQFNRVNVRFLKSIVTEFSCIKSSIDDTSKIIQDTKCIPCFNPIVINFLNELSSVEGIQQKVIDYILSKIHSVQTEYDVLLIEGVNIKFSSVISSDDINYEIARSINAEIIFCCNLEHDNLFDIKNIINIININFKKVEDINIQGIIINGFTQKKNYNFEHFNLFGVFNNFSQQTNYDVFKHNFLFKKNKIKVLGCVPWNLKLMEPSVQDVCCSYLNANIIFNHFINCDKYIRRFVVYDTNTDLNDKDEFDHSLLILSNISIENVEKMCSLIKSQFVISAVLLTEFSNQHKQYQKIIDQLKVLNCSILSVKHNILTVILLLNQFDFKSSNSIERLKRIRDFIPQFIDMSWIRSSSISLQKKCSVVPSLFIYNLKNLAKRSMKNIILPEGNELRIIKAASICSSDNIAYCTLLGDPNEIKRIANFHNISLNSNIEIIDPKLIRKNYVERLFYLRKKNGMTILNANELVKNNSILSTLLLESKKVDGLVSGSVSTTSSTVLPAFQLIKTSRGSSLISSVFFMLLSDYVVLYADCAININPDADQLSEIAVQSSNTARLFGIYPRISMLSYATGSSSSGSTVEKVKKATEIVQRNFPDLIIDGPIQYDAAISEVVSKLKCPGSLVSGKATIFVFPELNSGNITYKAVQRSTNTVSIGPILQGINRPVNDLSRGSSVRDIVYTIAVTAVQSNNI